MFVVQSSRIMSSSLSLLRRLVRMSPEVDRAMRGSCGPMGSKVVLLESAILTHGLPYPDNLRMAGEVEDIIRQKVVVTHARENGTAQSDDRTNLLIPLLPPPLPPGRAPSRPQSESWTGSCRWG